MDNNSLAHTKWECKYHIVFAPKWRRQVIYKDIKADVGQILGTLCRRKGIEIIKYKYGNRHFWCRGYYVDTVGKNAAAIKTYIQNQLKEDLEYDQMSLVEYIDPFTGEPVKKNKK